MATGGGRKHPNSRFGSVRKRDWAFHGVTPGDRRSVSGRHATEPARILRRAGLCELSVAVAASRKKGENRAIQSIRAVEGVDSCMESWLKNRRLPKGL